jgi:hypothetical protein
MQHMTTYEPLELFLMLIPNYIKIFNLFKHPKKGKKADLVRLTRLEYPDVA